jgi:hypothetical protein
MVVGTDGIIPESSAYREGYDEGSKHQRLSLTRLTKSFDSLILVQRRQAHVG